METNTRRSVNFCLFSGRVVKASQMKKQKSKVGAKARLRIKQGQTSTYAYVDLYGFGETALKMNLICQVGNIILVNAHLCNQIYTNKKGEVKAKIYFLIDEIELVATENTKLSEQELNEATLELVDDLNPENYL